MALVLRMTLTRIWLLLLVMAPTTLLHLLLTRGDFGVSPDSVAYLTTAQTIVREKVIASPLPPPTDLVIGAGTSRRSQRIDGRSGLVLHPLTHWPPGYPLIVSAVMSGLHTTPIMSARLVTIISSGAILLLVVLLLRPALGTERAVLAAALVGVLPFLQWTGRVAWSEPPFTAMTLVSIACLIRWRSDSQRRMRWLLAASCLAASATYVRYVGIAIYALLLVMLSLEWFHTRNVRVRRPLIWATVVGIGLYPFLVAPLGIRNLDLTGSAVGVSLGPSSVGLAGSLQATATSLLGGFLPWVRFKSGAGDFLQTFPVSLGIWTAAIVISLVLLRWRSAPLHSQSPRLQRCPMDDTVLVLGVFGLIFVVQTVIAAALWNVSASQRLLYPAHVCVGILLTGQLFQHVTTPAPTRMAVMLIPIAAIATASSLTFCDRFVPWKGVNRSETLEHPVVDWTLKGLEMRKLPPVRVEPGLLWSLHYATSLVADRPADIDRLPELNDLETELDRHTNRNLFFIIQVNPLSARYACPAYRRRYLQVLNAVADSAVAHDQFTVWWVRWGPIKSDLLRAEFRSSAAAKVCDAAPSGSIRDGFSRKP